MGMALTACERRVSRIISTSCSTDRHWVPDLRLIVRSLMEYAPEYLRSSIRWLFLKRSGVDIRTTGPADFYGLTSVGLTG